ncbi:hypothetical protein K7X08_018243 [Anisodus acutangulus]|uniref:Mediator of RNA polymerase II transcription subunit 21 n=1 Tax=Anisodus acutangulus TaxID=402998 RepID=A0A9Q1LY26_9SOLA|nr:hypothetical protein K7X08_018243 [Anisodus acutangulus]
MIDGAEELWVKTEIKPKILAAITVHYSNLGKDLQDGYHITATGAKDSTSVAEQPKQMSAAFVKAAKQVDALVAALPLSDGGEEAQLKRIAELQAENDAVGQELQKQLEAAEKELKQVQELFNQATDNCLNLKKPE